MTAHATTKARPSTGWLTPPESVPKDDGPFKFHQVYAAELAQLRGTSDALNAVVNDARGARARELFAFAGALAKRGEGLSALCLSGGGIRSATFNLGVIQGLARAGALSRFDYLSTVSGGGYIGGWLQAWMARAGENGADGAAAVQEALGCRPSASADPLQPEPKPVQHLREYSNYLTPRVGLFSPDTWAAGATILRNLVLNWLVIVPVLALLVMVPQLTLVIAQAQAGWGPGARWTALVGALAVALIASHGAHACRRPDAKMQGATQEGVVRAVVVPLYVAAALLALSVAGLRFVARLSSVEVAAFAILWCVAIPVAGWLLSGPKGRVHELPALVLSGLVGAGVLFALHRWALPPLQARPPLFVIVTLPLLLGTYLVVRILYTGFMRIGELSGARQDSRHAKDDDFDREWWARLSGWVLFAALGWLAFSAICLLGGWLLDTYSKVYVPKLVAALGGVSGVASALLAKSPDTTSGRSGRAASPVKEIALRFAAPIFCVSLVLLLGHGTTLLARGLSGDAELLKVGRDLTMGARPVGAEHIARLLEIAGALALVAAAMSALVNVNRYSLHGFYRNRLVRAYLGASRPVADDACAGPSAATPRSPDPFTGFDPEDNLDMRELLPPRPKPGRARQPLLVVNAALNLVQTTDKLAWQQRKAESFSMSPLFCGSFREGYRKTTRYGGRGGVSLGTAIAISGAAANPNMGYHSSATLAFLMTLFNVRLGAWLGNTNAWGNGTFAEAGPRNALGPIVAELLGRTTARSEYVNLSDGGHFENLGLYEMVLRRVRHIVVCDAGQDPTPGFEDLGNAVRKVRIDLGVPIDFEQRIVIAPRAEGETRLYCAVARIRYSEVDGDVPDGEILYFKPALYDYESAVAPLPYDVVSYSNASDGFPHESTVDQFFDESQFESYRALGRHAFDRVTRALVRRPDGRADATPAMLIEVARQYVKRENGAPPASEHAKLGEALSRAIGGSTRELTDTLKTLFAKEPPATALPPVVPPAPPAPPGQPGTPPLS